MCKIIVYAFAMLGGFTAACIIEEVILIIWKKIKRWRRDGCKIKCLCKPHIYKAYWIDDSGKAFMKCKKCGKNKKIVIDIKSFEDKL